MAQMEYIPFAAVDDDGSMRTVIVTLEDGVVMDPLTADYTPEIGEILNCDNGRGIRLDTLTSQETDDNGHVTMHFAGTRSNATVVIFPGLDDDKVWRSDDPAPDLPRGRDGKLVFHPSVCDLHALRIIRGEEMFRFKGGAIRGHKNAREFIRSLGVDGIAARACVDALNGHVDRSKSIKFVLE